VKEPVDRDVADAPKDAADPTPEVSENIGEQRDYDRGDELPLRSTPVAAIVG
jgi:hypothetical protein